VQEADSQVQLAVAFQGLDDAGRDLLNRVLEARERKGTGSGAVTGPRPPRPDADRAEAAATEPEPESEPESGPESEPGPIGVEVRRRLDRRTARLLVVAQPGEDQAAVLGHLQANGFWRIDPEPDLFAAHARLKAEPVPYRLLVVDLEASRREGLEAVGAVRHLEPLLRSFGDLPVAVTTRQPDPMLELLDKPNLGAVAREGAEPGSCLRILDGLIRIA
jgi:hypothetical protein